MLGERIRTARTAAGLTQTAFAHHFRVTQGAVSHWENGGAEPSREDLAQIAKLTRCDPWWLLTGDFMTYDCSIHKTNWNKDGFSACPICESNATIDRASDIAVAYAVSTCRIFHDRFFRQHVDDPNTPSKDELIAGYLQLADQIEKFKSATALPEMQKKASA